MTRAPCLLAALACIASAACAHLPAASLYEDAYLLADPRQKPAAAARLAAAGPDGIEVLLAVARSGGDEAALDAAARSLKCQAFFERMPFALPFLSASMAARAPWKEAASLLVERLAAHPEVLQAFRASADPVRRSWALLARLKEPTALFADLGSFSETDPRTVTVAAGLARCALGAGLPPDGWQALDEALARRSKDLESRIECSGPGPQADAARDLLLQETPTTRGHIGDGASRVATFSVGGQRLRLRAGCAMAVYDALAAKGKHEPHLLASFLSREVPRAAADAAADRAIRDIQHFPADARQTLAAALLNTDHLAPIAIDASGPGTRPDLLEAAARQGRPEAQEAIWKGFTCRGLPADGERIRLLGFLKSAQAATAAAHAIGEACPEARPFACAALIRLGDQRAVGFIAPSLSSAHAGRLEPTLLELWSPPIIEELERIAKGSDALAAGRARRLLDMAKAEAAAQSPPP